MLRRGYCAPTSEHGDCARGTQGSWPVTDERMRSDGSTRRTGEPTELPTASKVLLQCARHCLACARCTYISFSPDDCSWFFECDTNRLSTRLSKAHQTTRVRARRLAAECHESTGLCLAGGSNKSIDALDFAIAHHSSGLLRRTQLLERLLDAHRAFDWDGFRYMQNYCQVFARPGQGSAFALSASRGDAHRPPSPPSHPPPSLPPPCDAGARPRRTLAILLSETRSWDLTWERFQAHLLEPLSAELALCVSQRDNRTHGHRSPFYRHASHIWVFREPRNFSRSWDHAFEHERRIHHYSHTSWRALLRVKSDHNTGSWLGGVEGATIKYEDGLGQVGYSGGELYARWVLVQHLATVLHRYARVVLTRSDTLFCAPHPPVDFEHIWIPRGEEDWYGITDRHAVLPADVALQSISILTHFFRDPSSRLDSDPRGRVTRPSFMANGPRIRVRASLLNSIAFGSVQAPCSVRVAGF